MHYQQVEVSECGLACLAYAAARLGAEHDMAELRRKYPVSHRGLSFGQISDIAAALNMLARGVQCELRELGALSTPAILHWGLNHFVVLEKVTRRGIRVFDPATGRRIVSPAEADKLFTGVALEISAAPGFQRRKERSPLTIRAWIRPSPELYGGLAKILLLSLLLQLYVLASPFYVQLAVDQAALKGDRDLLMLLAIGFGLFGIFNATAAFLRAYATQHLSLLLSWDMSLRLFRHLVRLPLPWFQKRRLADTISRFEAINPIRDLVSGALVTALIDGMLAITTFVMMVLFAWPLACVVLAGVVVYVAVALASLPAGLRLGMEVMLAEIAENGRRIETIRAIQTIKAMSAESAQEREWSNKYSDVLRKTLTNARYNSTVAVLQQAAEVITATLVVYLGARAIIATEISVGILFAFMSYMGQFRGAVANLLAQVIQWRLTDIYSYRLADIVLNPTETAVDTVDTTAPALQGRIDVENVSFRYGPLDPMIFSGVNLNIAAGECVAIVGPSGVGKSTLLKVLTGLYPATSGEVRIDGRTVGAWGPRQLRANIGIVLQDDELISGTIIENVSFFAESVDLERVWEVLDAVALKDEILAMPMKGHSFVGDMGAALSGGQKQRLLLARALYKRPAILFMDEATSHLDIQNERRINEYIKSLKITRIIVAHRPETIRSADWLYDLRLLRSIRMAPNELKAGTDVVALGAVRDAPAH